MNQSRFYSKNMLYFPKWNLALVLFCLTIYSAAPLEKKFGADSSCRFREKRKKCTFKFQKMTSPRRRLGYSNNQLKTMVSEI